MILSVYLTTVTDLNMLARGPGPEAEAELGAACCPVLLENPAVFLTCTAVSRTAPTVRTVLSGLGTSALLLNISLLSSGTNSSLSCPTVKLHLEDLSIRTLCGRQPLQPRWWKTRFTTVLSLNGSQVDPGLPNFLSSEGDGEAPLKFVKQIQRQATSCSQS